MPPHCARLDLTDVADLNLYEIIWLTVKIETDIAILPMRKGIEGVKNTGKE